MSGGVGMPLARAGAEDDVRAGGLEALIAGWEGLAVVVRHDAPTDAWIFIALHDLTLGPGVGGCRMRVYPTPADGLRDAMRLAEGMTEKWAVIGFPVGGAKAVLAVPRPLEGAEREGLLRRFGRLVESLRGAYGAGEDLGTTPADMAIVGEETRYAHGAPPHGEPVDPGPWTALGVFAGMRAALRHLHGGAAGLEGRRVLARETGGEGASPRGDVARELDGARVLVQEAGDLGTSDRGDVGRELDGARVLVQGAGDVGAPLARLLADVGARVLISDVDDAHARRVAAEVGGDVVDPGDAYDTACDLFAPCAIGGVLSAETIPRLRCRVVAGSANNQLATDDDADALHARGILYVPDFVVNAGGATALPMVDRGRDEAAIRARVERIGAVVAEVLSEAAERGEPPLRAARRRVRWALEAGPEGLSFE